MFHSTEQIRATARGRQASTNNPNTETITMFVSKTSFQLFVSGTDKESAIDTGGSRSADEDIAVRPLTRNQSDRSSTSS